MWLPVTPSVVGKSGLVNPTFFLLLDTAEFELESLDEWLVIVPVLEKCSGARGEEDSLQE